MVFRSSARSDLGHVWPRNLDAVHAGTRLLALTSGLSGPAAGDLASSLVLAALVPLQDGPPGDPARALRAATLAGNAAIRRRGRDDPDLAGMAAVLTAVLLDGRRLGLVHVGGSRAYLLRGPTFRRLTRDDTAAQALVDEGRIAEEEVPLHPMRQVLLRAIDGRELELTPTLLEAEPGDRYLLCSDGMSGVLSDETLADILCSPLDPHACADRLVEQALRSRAPDTVTCVVGDVVRS